MIIKAEAEKIYPREFFVPGMMIIIQRISLRESFHLVLGTEDDGTIRTISLEDPNSTKIFNILMWDHSFCDYVTFVTPNIGEKKS